MTRAGGFCPFSRELNGFDVSFASSLPVMPQPKLMDGLSSHDCASATIWGVEPQVYVPVELTDRLALTVPEKSLPAFVHVVAGEKRCGQVGSPVAAGAPLPSFCSALELPSPQSASSRCSCVVCGLLFATREARSVRLTAVMVEPAGTFPALSKAMSVRRLRPSLVLPVKM